MEKMKTLTIGGVTYAVCAPLTEEEKQEVTSRVLDGIAYADILAPHKKDIATQAALDVKAELDRNTTTLTEADFAFGRSTSTSLGFNYDSKNAVATPAFLPCTEDEPYSTTVNEGLKGTYSVVYYHNETILGVVSGLKTPIQNLCDFGGFDNAGIDAKQVTHIRVMIVYPGSNGDVTPDNFPDIVGSVTFSRTYTDPHIRRSDLDAFGKKLNVREKPLKVIFLGDSITAGSAGPSWTTPFLEKIHGELIANVAVGGANLKDMEGTEDKSDLSYEYDKDNVLSNQVHHILAHNYAAPDIILIAIGTNDGIVITEADMDEAYAAELEKVNRKTAAGAFRYASEMLHDKYPNAVIFWCSPIHRAKNTVDRAVRPSDVRKWNESLRIATEYTGLQHIDTLHCGICSAYERDGAAGQYLKDGLHPNAAGAKKIGYYNAGKVNATIF